LVPGTVLEGLPVANPAYCPAGSRAYVVRDKETVFSIASRFNTTVTAIAALNQLDAQYHIDMTQVICIPNQG
jgi:spore germination protein YaaH